METSKEKLETEVEDSKQSFRKENPEEDAT